MGTHWLLLSLVNDFGRLEKESVLFDLMAIQGIAYKTYRRRRRCKETKCPKLALKSHMISPRKEGMKMASDSKQ